jgi:hypothetical protein
VRSRPCSLSSASTPAAYPTRGCYDKTERTTRNQRLGVRLLSPCGGRPDDCLRSVYPASLERSGSDIVVPEPPKPAPERIARVTTSEGKLSALCVARNFQPSILSECKDLVALHINYRILQSSFQHVLFGEGDESNLCTAKSQIKRITKSISKGQIEPGAIIILSDQ